MLLIRKRRSPVLQPSSHQENAFILQVTSTFKTVNDETQVVKAGKQHRLFQISF